MSQEAEHTGTTQHTDPHKKRINPLIFIVGALILFFLIGKILPASYISKPKDISAVANLTENELIFMKCDKYEELNKDSQEEVVRMMFAHYKLPITEDGIKEERENVEDSCADESKTQPIRGYVRGYLGIMEIPNSSW